MRPRQERKETRLTVKLEASPGSQPWASTLIQTVSQSVQSLGRVRLFATPWIAARQASLSITNSRSLLKLMSIESVTPSRHLSLAGIYSSLGLSRGLRAETAPKDHLGAPSSLDWRGGGDRASPQAARAPPHPTAANQKLRWQQGAHCRGECVILLRTSGFQTGNVTHTWREVGPGVCPGKRRLQTFLPDKFSRRRCSARLSHSGEGGNQAG